MNTKTCKKISKHSNVLLLEWLKTLIPEDDHDKVDIKNLHQYLPEANYFYANKQIRLSFYSPKWVRKGIKKLVKRGISIDNITMYDLETLAKNHQVADEY